MPPQDDSPFPRHPPKPPATTALWRLLAAVILAGGAAAYYLYSSIPPAPLPAQIRADSVPREFVSSRVLPLNPTPGAFIVKGKGNDTIIGPGNPTRYAVRMRVLQSIDARRLVEALDDMLVMRIGVGNEGLAKAKLREIRREIFSRAPRQ